MHINIARVWKNCFLWTKMSHKMSCVWTNAFMWKKCCLWKQSFSCVGFRTSKDNLDIWTTVIVQWFEIAIMQQYILNHLWFHLGGPCDHLQHHVDAKIPILKKKPFIYKIYNKFQLCWFSNTIRKIGYLNHAGGSWDCLQECLQLYNDLRLL